MKNFKQKLSWLMVLCILLSMPEMSILASELQVTDVVSAEGSVSGSDLQNVTVNGEDLAPSTQTQKTVEYVPRQVYASVEGMGHVPVEDMIPNHGGDSYTMVLFDVNMSDSGLKMAKRAAKKFCKTLSLAEGNHYVLTGRYHEYGSLFTNDYETQINAIDEQLPSSCRIFFGNGRE